VGEQRIGLCCMLQNSRSLVRRGLSGVMQLMLPGSFGPLLPRKSFVVACNRVLVLCVTSSPRVRIVCFISSLFSFLYVLNGDELGTSKSRLCRDRCWIRGNRIVTTPGQASIQFRTLEKC
jgi:hypothetical protein